MLNAASLSQLIHSQAAIYGQRTAILCEGATPTKEWRPLSWTGFARMADQAASAYLNIGIRPTDRIAIYAANSCWYLIAEFAAWRIGAVTVPIYATSSPQQVAGILSDSGARLVIADEGTRKQTAQAVAARLRHVKAVVAIAPASTGQGRSCPCDAHEGKTFQDLLAGEADATRKAEADALASQVTDGDIATVMYTSGTTGGGKGVILTHGQFRAALKANAAAVRIGERDRVLGFLPYAHIFEKGWACLCLASGAVV